MQRLPKYLLSFLMEGVKKAFNIFLFFLLPFVPPALLVHTIVQSHCFNRTVGIRIKYLVKLVVFVCVQVCVCM